MIKLLHIDDEAACLRPSKPTLAEISDTPGTLRQIRNQQKKSQNSFAHYLPIKDRAALELGQFLEVPLNR